MKTLFFLCFIFSSFSSFACEQKGVIQSIQSEKEVVQFELDNGFTIKLAQGSVLIPLLYHAASNNDEVCATHIFTEIQGENAGSAGQITVRKRRRNN